MYNILKNYSSLRLKLLQEIAFKETLKFNDGHSFKVTQDDRNRAILVIICQDL